MAIEDPQPSRVIGPPPEPPKPGDKPPTPKQLLDLYLQNPPDLVKHLGAANLVTNVSLAALLEPIAKDIKEIRGEVVNPFLVEMLKQLRLEGAANALKKSPIYEDNPDWLWWVGTGIAGIIVTILAARFIAKLPARIVGAANAAGDLTPEQVQNLRTELDLTNPALADFVKEVRRLPRAKELAARAKAIGTLNTAVANQNNGAVEAAAEAIRKLKTALRNFDHKKIPRDHAALTKTADALDKLRLAIGRLKLDDVRNATSALLRLKLVIRNLKPENIPKSGDMRAAAKAANSLDKAARNLRGSLTPLGPALRGVSTAAAATAGALGA
ncbi:hypothetical protein OG625_15610 [Streptomyces sp. NBC_01351]|uniref:hypothetical protein n=1 Tax=Streptomyces sp. NBC_01351 TaxID=2903833 RepID=UPI002E31ECF1|nr:hypothetical protein [Streptomyces sp. NBC_01351]